MARRFAPFLLILGLVSKVLTQSQPSLAQYLQLAGLGHGSPQNVPSSNYQNYRQSSREVPRTNPAPIPNVPIPNLPNLPVVLPSKPPVIPKNSPLNTDVLNNLAIALQLLIVSNILSTPPCEHFSKLNNENLAPVLTYPVSQPYKPIESPKSVYYESLPPNSNFLGTSGFVEPSVFGSSLTVRPSPRANMALMSPYEALGSSSPYSDPIMSTAYAPTYSKRDFQSPYAAILSSDGNRDLIALADLF